MMTESKARKFFRNAMQQIGLIDYCGPVPFIGGVGNTRKDPQIVYQARRLSQFIIGDDVECFEFMLSDYRESEDPTDIDTVLDAADKIVEFIDSIDFVMLGSARWALCESFATIDDELLSEFDFNSPTEVIAHKLAVSWWRNDEDCGYPHRELIRILARGLAGSELSDEDYALAALAMLQIIY